MSFDTTKAELEKLFGDVGELAEVFLPTDRETGRPRGFAFVEFTDAAAAAAATQRFDGFELNGRPLRVNEAQERRPRAPSFNAGPPPPDFGNSPFGGHGGGRGGPPGGGGKPKGSRRNLRRKKRSL